MSEERVMTIARGLTRLKTIKNQMQTILGQIQSYSAWNNKKKHPLGDNKATVEQSLNQAQEYINSLYQQYNDLTVEYTKIKKAIDKTNMVTPIRVAGKDMTVYEAITYKRDLVQMFRDLNQSFAYAVNNAQRDVDRYNSQFVSITDENAKKVMMADISYFIDKSKVEDVNKFLVDFMDELDGELNAVNAITTLIFE